MKKFTLAIIGSGPGGYVAAIKAAQAKQQVVLIEENFLGGICLNEGCIPTKCLLAHADLLYQMQNSAHFHIFTKELSFDFFSMVEKKNETVLKLRKNLENLLLANGVHLISGRAHFLNEHTLQVKEEKIQADSILIAVGSGHSKLPNISCDDKFIYSSSSLLDMHKLPKSLAILGGGYIGCEMASLFSTFGVEVTIIEALPTILFHQSSLLAKELTKIFTKRKIRILCDTKVLSIEKSVDQVTLLTDKNETIVSEKALLAVGRCCNIQNLSLPSSVHVDKKGFILTNEHMQTTCPHIYAVGDVTGIAMLAHVASHQAAIAVENMTGKATKMSYRAIPSVIFTNPPLASVGLTEAKAQELTLDYFSASYPYRALGKSQIYLDPVGLAQLIVEKKSQKILGAHILGDGATELISEMSLAIQKGLTLQDIVETIHPHPTYSEIWAEVANLAMGHPLHFPPKKSL